METDALVETVEKQTAVFPLFPQRLENAPKSVAFSTVTTAPTTGHKYKNENEKQKRVGPRSIQKTRCTSKLNSRLTNKTYKRY
jgi:hypothetical protein